MRREPPSSHAPAGWSACPTAVFSPRADASARPRALSRHRPQRSGSSWRSPMKSSRRRLRRHTSSPRRQMRCIHRASRSQRRCRRRHRSAHLATSRLRFSSSACRRSLRSRCRHRRCSPSRMRRKPHSLPSTAASDPWRASRLRHSTCRQSTTPTPGSTSRRGSTSIDRRRREGQDRSRPCGSSRCRLAHRALTPPPTDCSRP